MPCDQLDVCPAIVEFWLGKRRVVSIGVPSGVSFGQILTNEFRQTNRAFDVKLSRALFEILNPASG